MLPARVVKSSAPTITGEPLIEAGADHDPVGRDVAADERAELAERALVEKVLEARAGVELAKHHGKGKLDARARLEHLLDKGSFREFGTLVGGDIAADGIVAGSGLINGSPVMVGAEDFTTLAGSIGPAETPNVTGWPNSRCATRFRL